MIGKDIYGKPKLYMTREKDSKKFEVLADKSGAIIIERRDSLIDKACLANPVLIWEDTPEFPNKIRAYLWLKEHIDDLL